MSNAGKRVMNWKKDYPILRSALGLLGRQGYTSKMVARHLLSHECTEKARKYCRNHCGRELVEEAIVSRLKRVEELTWLEENNPVAFAKGKILCAKLSKELEKAGIERYGVLG